MKDPVHILLFGAGGRMGKAIRAIVDERDDVLIAAQVDNRRARIGDSLSDAGVVVDFTSPDGADNALSTALDLGIPIVSGTTGLPEAVLHRFENAAAHIPVMLAPNMSLGVAVVRHLTRLAASALPASFEPEIVELHHRNKRDAPSGTGLALVEAVREGRGRGAARPSRAGMVGARTPEEIGVFGVRGGDVVGEHTVFFLGDGERVELTHRATDRAIFARGAVEAARWIAGRAAGAYTIDDVLGLRGST